MECATDWDSAPARCRRLGRNMMDTGIVMRMMRTLGRAALGLVAATLLPVAPAGAEGPGIGGTVGSPSASVCPVFSGLDKGFCAAENVKPDLIYVPASAPVTQHLAAGWPGLTMSTGLVDPIRPV